MRSPLAAVLCLLGTTVLTAQETKPAAAPKPAAKPAPKAAATQAPPATMSEDDKTLYSVGLTIWKSLSVFDLTPAEVALVQRGLADAAAGKPAAEVNADAYQAKVGQLVKARQQVKTDKEKARSAEYLTKAEKEPGAVKTESGLVYTELTPGSGEAPKSSDMVKVHYRGTLVDGTEFDSSYKRNEPAQFPLTGVIKCWTEGVQKMKVGGKSRLVCPSAIAYGDNGRPSIPGGATLVFEVELVEIVAPATPAPTPTPTPAAKQ